MIKLSYISKENSEIENKILNIEIIEDFQKSISGDAVP